MFIGSALHKSYLKLKSPDHSVEFLSFGEVGKVRNTIRAITFECVNRAIVLLSSYYRVFTILLSYYRHRSTAFSPSYYRHRSIAFSPSYYRIIVIVLSCFHHRTIVVSSSCYRVIVIVLPCFHRRIIVLSSS